jgi:hypothetical protein
MMITAIPICLSAAALILSFYVFIDSHRQDRRNVLLKMHELLISDNLQKGRYLLFEKVVDEASVERLSGRDYRYINRALAAYNLLGLYVKKGYVDIDDVLDIWAVPIYRAWVAAQPFFAHREKNVGHRLGRFFEPLAQRARDELIHRGDGLEYSTWRRSKESE